LVPFFCLTVYITIGSRGEGGASLTGIQQFLPVKNAASCSLFSANFYNQKRSIFFDSKCIEKRLTSCSLRARIGELTASAPLAGSRRGLRQRMGWGGITPPPATSCWIRRCDHHADFLSRSRVNWSGALFASLVVKKDKVRSVILAVIYFGVIVFDCWFR